MTQPFLSYAQTGEDVLLWRALGDQTPGFYVDAGASDPSFLSVTRALYDRGWRGIDIEPLPEKAALLRQARPRNVVIEAALSDAPGRATLYRVDLEGDTGLSTFDQDSAHQAAARSGAQLKPVEVAVTTLAAICHAHVPREVHVLKIDVEGAEAAVLRGADFRAIRPWVVLIEATRPASGEPAIEWEGLLLQAGYQFVWFDGLNRFYVAAERHAALARHFTVPPNPFDHYEVFNPGNAAECAKLDALARSRLDRINALEAELETLRPSKPPPAPLPKPPSAGGRGLDEDGTTKPNQLAPKQSRNAPSRIRSALQPVIHRLRSALLGPIPNEIAVMRLRQDDVLARLEQALQESAGPAMDAKLAHAIERALQALVAERDA